MKRSGLVPVAMIVPEGVDSVMVMKSVTTLDVTE